MEETETAIRQEPFPEPNYSSYNFLKSNCLGYFLTLN